MWSSTPSSRETARCCWCGARRILPKATRGDGPGAPWTGTRHGVALGRDEQLSGGVRRELREETGWEWRVSALMRIISRPDRPHEDRQNVAFDFVITPLEKIGEPDKESSAVEWVPIERLPPLHTLAFDHGETVQLYLASRGKPARAPIVV